MTFAGALAALALGAPSASSAGKSCGTLLRPGTGPIPGVLSPIGFKVDIARRTVTYAQTLSLYGIYSWACDIPRPAGRPVLEFRPVSESAYQIAAVTPFAVNNGSTQHEAASWEAQARLTGSYRLMWHGYASEPVRVAVGPATAQRCLLFQAPSRCIHEDDASLRFSNGALRPAL